jgi:AcrR family transcriptional regulator
MPRTLNPVAHAIKRDAFLDVGERLIRTQGYEQMTVQDVLDDLGTSKGAFYHYFDSKAALLAAVIERMVETATGTVEPLAADPQMSAVKKLEGVFSGIAQWKGERPELQPEVLSELLRTWFSDENRIVREQLRRSTAVRLTPLLVGIVRQGQAEGTFSASSAEGAAGVLLVLILGLNETRTELFLARQANTISFEEVESRLGAYVEALERVLGLPAASLAIGDQVALRQWFD